MANLISTVYGCLRPALTCLFWGLTAALAYALPEFLSFEFPKEQAVGKLYFTRVIADNFVERSEGATKWIWARGTVKLPATQQFSLFLNYAGVEDPSFIDRLSPECKAQIVEVDMRSVENVQDTTLSHLRGLTKVRHLNIDNTDVTDAGLAPLSSLEKLYGLSMNGTLVKGPGLQYLANLPRLTTLSFSCGDLRGGKLSALPGFKHLTILGLSSTCLTDRALQYIGRVPSLLSLDISRNNVTDKGLSSLTDLQQLVSLNLQDTKITANAVASLSKLPRLSTLDLWENQLPKEDLAKMQKALPHCHIQTHKRDSRIDSKLFSPLK
jgi:hypothetical protein